MFAKMLNIKKLVFIAALIIPASFFLTCDNHLSPNVYDPPVVDRPVNTGDDSYTVTVYLDGSPPVLYSRALTKDLAILGHDYFEVTFVRRVSGGLIIARAAWEKGHAAGVSGVARGVDYRYTSVEAADENNGGVAAPGAALLFVGKRSDRTLLGVGQLTGTDDGGSSSTFISANTRSVTFTVKALKAGARRNESVSSSDFLTGGSVNGYNNPNVTDTHIKNAIIVNRVFPLYNLNINQTTYARYSIDVGGFEDGIFTAGPLTLAQVSGTYRLTPRYPIGAGGEHEKFLTPTGALILDNNTIVMPENNQSAGVAFNNHVLFSFNTVGTTNSSIFAFAFEIPVYPLTNADSRASGDLWYIRPGYDTYLYDLDDGMGGTGGAILIGIGNIDESLEFKLVVVTKPRKERYYDKDPPTSTDWLFEINPIVIYLYAGDTPVRNIDPYGSAIKYTLRRIDGSGTEIQIYPDIDNLYTYLHDPAFVDPDPDTGGLLTVHIEYTDPDTGEKYYSGFPIRLYENTGNIPGSSNIPFQNRIVISNDLDLQNMDTLTPDVYLILLYDSQNFPIISLTGTGFTLIILAAQPDVIIGKSGANGGFLNNVAGNIYYFGNWPYNEDLIIGGNNIGGGYPYRINAMGRYETIDNPAPEYPGSYFVQRSDSAFESVVEVDNVSIRWPDNLKQPP